MTTTTTMSKLKKTPAKVAYIATLDVGTTNVRCFIINGACETLGSAFEAVKLLNIHPGYLEIEPENLWKQILRVLKSAVAAAQLQPQQLTGLAISTQRCTFLTWNHRTQDYFHNFITWKDLRADALVDAWNAGYILKTINLVSYALFLVTRSKRFLAGSVLKMMNGQVTLRLLHEIRHNTRLQQAIKDKKARIELLDSWILYKLRSGNGLDPNVEHITDITSCTATGLFDPFTLGWSSLIKTVFGIEVNLLPRIVDNAYKHFGTVHPHAFKSGDDNDNNEDKSWKNTHLPICASVSDQTAALWGSHCFSEGDAKVTIGTGAFLNLMTGKNCAASVSGMYPLVAWQFKDVAYSNSNSNNNNNKYNKNDETIFCMEGAAHDMGTIIAWAQACGLFNDIAETAAIAASVESTNGVYFVPAFSGLGPPINDHKAGSGFIGITPSTKQAHLVRAILESIVFRLVQLCETAEQETNYKLKLIKVDGGVSRNDFVCQFFADTSGLKIERAQNSESSVMGATYIAALNSNIWTSIDEIRKFRRIDKIFEPQPKTYDAIRKRMDVWSKAIGRFGNWY